MHMHRKSLVQLGLLSLLLFVISLVFQRTAPDYLLSKALLFLVPFFFLVSIISRYVIFYAMQKRKNLTHYFLVSTVIKFMFYLFVLIFYAFLYREDAIAFILSFFVFYLIYTLVDVISIMRMLAK